MPHNKQCTLAVYRGTFQINTNLGKADGEARSILIQALVSEAMTGMVGVVTNLDVCLQQDKIYTRTLFWEETISMTKPFHP